MLFLPSSKLYKKFKDKGGIKVRKNNKRILSAGLVLCMLVSLFSMVAYADGNNAFVSGQYETVSGENIQIELKATDSTGVIAMLCEIEFDGEFLEILRYDDAKLIGGTLTAKTDESPLRLFWMDALATENTLVNGTLGTFTFKAKKAGKTEINVNYIEAYTKDGDLVPFENAVIEVNIKESDTPVVEAKEYTIKATAGANGKINPSGEIKATEGKQLLFIFTPDSGYKVNDVKVDGKSVGAVLEYTFESVNADSTIEVSFKKVASSGGSSGGSSSSGKSDKETIEKPIEETTTKEDTKKEEAKDEPIKTEWVNPFSDVKTDDWYYEYVKYINEKNLMKGISETEFAPNNTVTRAMFVTVLYRLEKEPTGAKADFADVLDGTYYENAVGWAVQNGIVNGVSETEFAPDNTITREQMATIIHRYMKFKGLDMSAGENADTASFEDFENVSDYAKDAFRYACSNGIISGTSKSTLSPKESATRAQMAAIFQRCEKVLLNQ